MLLDSKKKLLIVIGEHEFDQYDLRELLISHREYEVRFCLSEMDVTYATARHEPVAFLVCCGWEPERLTALLKQLEPPQDERIPVYLFGRAVNASLESAGPYEIHRLLGGVPELDDLESYQNAPVVDETLPAIERASTPPPQPADIAALPRFLGGIAHDFNNLLASIMGEVQLAQSRCDEERVGRHLLRANDACARMAAEIRKLLVFQESASERRGMVDCSVVMRDARSFLPELLGPDFDVEIVECTEPLWVEGTISGVRQIVLNLAAYAGQQVTHAHSIRVSLRRMSPAELAKSPTRRPNDPGQVLIEVAVRGDRSRESATPGGYEPIFSKPERDAGVGLAIVWKLVQDFGGSVSVLKDLSGSAAFRVLLPMAHPASESGALLDSLCGRERLLFISSDQPAFESVLRSARELGYAVTHLKCLEGIEAAVGTEGERPDCILLDTDCDGYDVVEAHRIIRALAPRVPLLLAAPLMAPIARPPFSNDGLACVVHKPLDIKEVFGTMRTLWGSTTFSPTPTLQQRAYSLSADNSQREVQMPVAQG